ncbi:hypothetical protein ZWY2020_044930 [Hordeum vulgare]|nr:hypothetical protein ZWY2020_044930 [Hordeum vulgare]
MMEGKKSHGGSGLWRQAPAPVRQLFRRVRRAVLRPKRPAVSFGPVAFLQGSSRVTRSISSRKMMEGKKSHGGSGLWRQAPAPVRQLFRRVRRAVLRPKRPALSFGYDLKSYSQNFNDGLAHVHHRFISI